MFPESSMFSKILENIKGDFSKSNNNNNNNFNSENNYNQESFQERAKSSLNRKNVFSSKYSLPEMKQINHKNEPKNKLINMKNTSYNQTIFYNSNREANNNNNNREPYLFSFNNSSNRADLNNPANNININHSYNNYNSNLIQKEFNKNFKKSEKFDINNFRLSNEDFTYSNNFDNMKLPDKNEESKNIALEKTQTNNNNNKNHNYDNNINDFNNNFHLDTDKLESEKLIHNYRLQLNKELLRRLYEEREKENIRDKLLNNAKDHNERKKMEQRFIFERAQASSEIIQINE